VDQALPIAILRAPRPARLGLLGRLVALTISVACLTILLIAARLAPSPTGIGSHTGLHFQRCQFEFRTGIPCPTCGMTTSFAHFVRGQFLASLYVQPMGMCLALLTTLTFWAALYIALTGRPSHRLFRFIPTHYYLLPIFTLTILAWAWKIWIHLSGRDGWG